MLCKRNSPVIQRLLLSVNKLVSIKEHIKSLKDLLISSELKESEILQSLRLVSLVSLSEHHWWDSNQLLNSWRGTSPFKQSIISLTVAQKLHTWVQVFCKVVLFSEVLTDLQQLSPPNIHNVLPLGTLIFQVLLPSPHMMLRTTEDFWKQPSDQMRLSYFCKTKIYMDKNLRSVNKLLIKILSFQSERLRSWEKESTSL